MKSLSAEYGKLDDPQRNADYKDPATRFAYVYKYVAAHGDCLAQLKRTLGHHIFTGEVARVSCVGGGPAATRASAPAGRGHHREGTH